MGTAGQWCTQGLPMIGEHYALQWKPPAEYDLHKVRQSSSTTLQTLTQAGTNLDY